jgi:prophage endopeptidase
MIPNPTLILAALVAGLTVYFYGHHVGYAEKETEVRLEVATKNEEARAREQELNTQLNANEAKLLEAQDVITQKQSALDRAINSGRVRLNSGCVPAGSGSTPASSGGNSTASESDRETLRLIAEIVAQGDRNTEQLNACIAAYNSVREQVNGQR